MSFSFSVVANDIKTSISSAVDDKIVALDDGPGKDEATHLADVIPKVIEALIGESSDFASASVNGYESGGSSQLTVYVTFRTALVNAEPTTST